MTIDQQRKMLEAAAKACGMSVIGISKFGLLIRSDGCPQGYVWAPHDTPSDTAEMCAELRISVLYEHDPCQFLSCFAHNSHDPEIAYYKDHDNSRLKAWMAAATMVAAKTQGYEP